MSSQNWYTIITVGRTVRLGCTNQTGCHRGETPGSLYVGSKFRNEREEGEKVMAEGASWRHKLNLILK